MDYSDFEQSGVRLPTELDFKSLSPRSRLSKHTEHFASFSHGLEFLQHIHTTEIPIAPVIALFHV